MEDLRDIARRLVEHPKFDHEAALHARWSPPVVPDGAAVGQALTYDLDLTKWATVGVLLGMLAEAAPTGIRLDVDDEEPGLARAWSDKADGWLFARHAQPGAAVALALLDAWGDP